jgi:serine/threonine protein kinase
VRELRGNERVQLKRVQMRSYTAAIRQASRDAEPEVLGTSDGPAKQLLGKTIRGRWRVIEPAPRHQGATGARFSQGYIVESSDTGKRAFLKALDLADVARAPDPARAIKAMTEAYVFERDLLLRCRDRHLDRIVVAIDSGEVGSSPADLVFFLVFELADGDARQIMSSAENIDLAWRLRALHHIATGLRQLHGQGTAHQDVKPSNVLLFNDAGCKLADLGRAASKGLTPPHEDLEIAGDRTYAPPELLYHHLSPDWNCRRLGCDAYLLGSMVVFFFARTAMTHLLTAELAPIHRPYTWPGTFADVMPYVRDAFGRAVEVFKASVPDGLTEPLVEIVRQLCEPDPALRGHPNDRRFQQYSLERYVSWFDLLARRVECALLHGRRN